MRSSMSSFRLAVPAVALGMAADGAGAQTAAPLAVKVYVGGNKQRVAAREPRVVLDSGKALKTILVSNADPDFYFGAETLKQFFPDARVVATASVREKIQAKLAGKLAFWGPEMGAIAPKRDGHRLHA